MHIIIVSQEVKSWKKVFLVFKNSSDSKLHFTGTQGKGYMPDGTSRISKDGKDIFHFMGCSTFAEYAVIAEISAAKIHPGADLYQMCLLGCGLVSSTPFGFSQNRR